MIAICIGHSRKINGRYDGGAYSTALGTNERTFNMEVAAALADILNIRRIPFVVISDYEGNGYGTAMSLLAKKIRQAGATLAIELHFNAASPEAHGHEWLYWGSSSKSKKAAETFASVFSEFFPHHKARGSKPKRHGDRGAEFLRLTHCPAVILEPFFGSSQQDSSAFATSAGSHLLADAYAAALIKLTTA